MSEKTYVLDDQAAEALTAGMTMSERRQALKERVQRHVEHLDALVQNLKELGVDNAAINARVAEVFEEYKAQLLRNIDLTGRAFGAPKNAAPNLSQDRPDTSSVDPADLGGSEAVPRIAKTGEQLEEIVLQHLRTQPETAGVVSVSVAPCSAGHGGWTVRAFQEGTSTRGGCLQGLHGILPVLQKQFALAPS